MIIYMKNLNWRRRNEIKQMKIKGKNNIMLLGN